MPANAPVAQRLHTGDSLLGKVVLSEALFSHLEDQEEEEEAKEEEEEEKFLFWTVLPK
jgi:hypothetical protein